MNENFIDIAEKFEHIGKVVLYVLVVLLLLKIRYLWCVPTYLKRISDSLDEIKYDNKETEHCKQIHLADVAHSLVVRGEKKENQNEN